MALSEIDEARAKAAFEAYTDAATLVRGSIRGKAGLGLSEKILGRRDRIMRILGSAIATESE